MSKSMDCKMMQEMMPMMMPMWFSQSYENTFLFSKFSTSTAKGYFPWLAGVFLMCVLVQFLQYFRTNF